MTVPSPNLFPAQSQRYEFLVIHVCGVQKWVLRYQYARHKKQKKDSID